MNKSRVTIKDLAKELKISTSTVSRALCDKWDVNSETRRAVLDLAEKWNYKPNPVSLSLKQSHSMFIGVIVPEFINSFFSEVIMGIQSVLNPEGYHILIMQSGESHVNELHNMKALEAQLVDGFLISVTQESENINYFSELISNNFPLVFFNRVCKDLNAPCVTIDDYKWAFNAVEHLILQGCKSIAHLAGPEELPIARNRREGYIDALRKYNLAVDNRLILDGGLTLEDGEAAAQTILQIDLRPDGIFAVNDPVAIGAMKMLQKKGICIPGDMAIVGFSESKLACIVEPNLTSVEQPTFEMGRSAAQLLLQQIRHQEANGIQPASVTLDARLNIRESSMKASV